MSITIASGIASNNTIEYPNIRTLVDNGSEFEFYYYDGTPSTPDNVRIALVEKHDDTVTLSDIPDKVDNTKPQITYSYQVCADAVIGNTYNYTAFYNSSDQYAVRLFRDDDNMQMIHRDDSYGEMTTGFTVTDAPSVIYTYASNGQTFVSGRTGTSGSYNIKVRASTYGDYYFNGWGSETTLKSLGSVDGSSAMVKYKDGKVGCVYSYYDGSSNHHLYYRHYNGSSWDSEQLLTDDLAGVYEFSAAVTTKDTLVVVFKSLADDTDLKYVTRVISDGTVSSESTFVSDLQTGLTNAGYKISSICADIDNPRIALFYYDGTNIDICTWTENTSSLGSGTSDTPSAFVSSVAFNSGYEQLICPAITIDKLAVIYRNTSDNLIMETSDYTMASGISDNIGISTGAFGKITDRQGCQKIISNGEKTLVVFGGIDNKARCRLYDNVNEEWDTDVVTISKRYWDNHNIALFYLAQDGYVWFLEGARANINQNHYITIKKSPYTFSDASFASCLTTNLTTWTDISPPEDAAGLFSCTRGYKEVLSDKDGNVFLFTQDFDGIWCRPYTTTFTTNTGNLLSETFEATGYDDADWTESAPAGTVVDSDSTTDPFKGSKCLHLNGDAAASNYAYNTITASGTVYARFAVKFTDVSPAGNELFFTLRAGATVNMGLFMGTDGKLLAVNGSSGASSAFITKANTWYYCQVQYEKGTGSNAITKVWINRNNDMSGDPDIDITDGTSTTDITRVFCQLSTWDTDIYFDNVDVNSSAFTQTEEDPQWFDPVNVMATTPGSSDGGYWAGNGIALGKETTGQQSLHLFFTQRDFTAYGSSNSWDSTDLAYVKLIYVGNGNFEGYKANDSEVSLPANVTNADIIVRHSVPYSYPEMVHPGLYSLNQVRHYDGHYYKCTTAGTTDSTAPTFDTNHYASTTDGTAVWEEQGYYTDDYIYSWQGYAGIVGTDTPCIVTSLFNDDSTYTGFDRNDFFIWDGDKWAVTTISDIYSYASMRYMDIDTDDNIYITGPYASKAIYYVKSSDNGSTFDSPKSVAESAESNAIWGTGTTFTNSGGSVVASFYAGDSNIFSRYDVRILTEATLQKILGIWY